MKVAWREYPRRHAKRTTSGIEAVTGGMIYSELPGTSGASRPR